MPQTMELNQRAARTEPAPVDPSPFLGRKIAGLRRRHVSVAVLTGVAIAVSVAIELLALEMFVDWWMELQWSVRFVLLMAQLAVLTYILTRLVFFPLWRQPDDDDVALMVEKARPTFRSRLIASLQLTRPGAIPPGSSAALVAAMVAETQTLAQNIDFNAIITTERLKKFGAMAATVLFIGILGVAYGRETAWDLLKRAFLSHTPVPRKTRVFVQEGDKTIGIGDNVRLEAWVQGIVPARGKVEVRYRTRRMQEYPLEQDKDNKIHFGRSIENVQESFTYQIYLNDGVSETCHVMAIPRPTVASIECEQEYPAYTRIKAAKRSLGDLSLLAGSKLRLRVTATKPIKTASIKLVGVDQEFPMKLEAGNPKLLTGEFAIPAKGLT